MGIILKGPIFQKYTRKNNMALIKCKECGREVSTEAAACPSCGAPTKPQKPQSSSTVIVKGTKQPSGCAILFLVLLIAWGVYKWSYEEDSKRPAVSEPSHAVTPEPMANEVRAQRSAAPVVPVPRKPASPMPTPFAKREIKHEPFKQTVDTGEMGDFTAGLSAEEAKLYREAKPIAAAPLSKAEIVESKKWHQAADKEAEALEKLIKWSLSGDPETAGKEDGAAFWDALSHDEKRTLRRINCAEVSQIISYNESMFLDSIGGVQSDGSKSYSEADSKKYTDAFCAAEKSAREKWLEDNIGERPMAVGKTFLTDGGDNYGMTATIRSALKSPDSFKFVECDVLGVVKRKDTRAWKVNYRYRATNSFGAIVTESVIFYVGKNGIIDAKRPKE